VAGDDLQDALAFIRDHGVVLASAKGPVPNLAQAIAGEPIRGSWWAHPAGREIYAVLQGLEDAPDILVCRLVGGKITFVHRRLWPALVRLADRFAAGRLDQIRQEHSRAGHHLNRTTPFPNWAPAEVREAAAGLSEEEAVAALGEGVAPAIRRAG
jgi:hypothetical protein